jgi:hypothetical protein
LEDHNLELQKKAEFSNLQPLQEEILKNYLTTQIDKNADQSIQILDLQQALSYHKS